MTRVFLSPLSHCPSGPMEHKQRLKRLDLLHGGRVYETGVQNWAAAMAKDFRRQAVSHGINLPKVVSNLARLYDIQRFMGMYWDVLFYYQLAERKAPAVLVSAASDHRVLAVMMKYFLESLQNPMEDLI